MYGPFADATAMSAAYAAQLDGLTVTQAEVALSTTGLSAAQQEEILTLYRGAAALTEYSVQQLAAKTGLNETQLATMLSCETTDQLTYSNMMLLLSTTELSAEEKARIASLMAQTGATAALDGATKSLNLSLGATLKLMWASPMGKLSILLTVLPLIIAGIKGFIKVMNDAHPSLNALKDDLDSLKTEEADLETQSSELNDRIKELQDLKDAGTITLTEEEELGRLERENELLRQQIELQKERIAAQEEAVHDKAESNASDFFNPNKGGNGVYNNNATGLKNLIDRYNQAKEEFSKAVNEKDVDSMEKWQDVMDSARDRIASIHSQLVSMRGDLGEDSEYLPKIDELLDSIAETLGLSSDGLSDSLRKAYDEYARIVADVERLNLDLSKTKFGNIDLDNRQVLEWTDDNLAKYKTAIESWGETVEDFAGTISTVFGGSENFDGVEIAFSPMLQTDHGAEFLSKDTVFKYINGLIREAGEGWTNEDLFRLDTEGLDVDGKHIKGLIADIGDTAIQTGEAMHYLGKDGAYNQSLSALREEADAAGISVEELKERMASGGAAAAAEAEELEKLKASATKATEALAGLQSQQSLVAGAAKEQTESGYLSVETYDKLIAASADYASCIEYENGSMQLNTEKAKELTDAKYELQLQEIELAKAQDIERWKENTAAINELQERYGSLTDEELAHMLALQDENGVLEQNIQKYNVMKSEIIELTGAYKEWLDAQSGPESGDMYDSLKTAQKAIEEGLESGKVGTAKYKSALKLLVPEDAKADAAAYMQNLQRYISDDSTGVTNFIHDMVTAGLMIEDGDNVQLVPDTAIQDICEKLHITPEMAKAIFGELEEYDFHFDWTDEDFEFNTDTSSLDEINAKIEETKQKIAEIKASTIDPQVKTEQLSAAKQEMQQLLQDKAALETPTEADVTTNSESAKTQLSELSGTLDEIAQKVDDVAAKKIGTLGAEKTSSSLQGIINRLNRINNIKLKDKSFTVTAVNVGGGVPGFSSAGGTQSAPGGKTLVGELGPELVVSGDRYYTVGDLGAEFVNLKAGDIVFNHEDTEKLLKGLTGVRGTALAQGTAMAGRVSGGGSLSNLSGYKVTSASTAQSKTTATVNVNVKSGAKDLSEALEDQLKTLKEELDDILGQFDFKIFMAEKHNASSKEIIEIYRKMQEAVHAQAEKYRSMGVDENNEYIRELKKQWWEYEDAIKDARKDEFEEWLKDSKFAIEAMDHDRAGTDKVLESWRTVLQSINDEIAYYTARGYDMASDEIQDLLKEAWDAESEIESILESALDAVNDSIDRIQDLYKTLKDAAEEFAETGYISLDAYQEIVNMGVEYMAYLRDENGYLHINRERVEAVLTAKTQQMAVEAALNYVRQIGLALANNETEELQRLLDATEQTSDATWGLVYANLAFLDLTDKQRAAARKNIDSLRAIANNVSANISKSLDDEDGSESVTNTKDALEDILELTKDLIKHEHDQMLDALDDQLDKYRDIINAKKESLALTKSELSYNKDIQDRTNEISQLQARIAALELDDSREAAIERAKLMEELAEKQSELEEKQRDHAYDLQVDSLDKLAEAQEKSVNERKEQIQNETSSEQKLYDLAIKKISEEWDTLEDQLLAWNTEYGRSLNKDVIEQWDAAREAAERYGSFVEALNQSGIGPDEEGENSTSDIVGKVDVFDDATRIQEIAEQMQKNSLEWFGATDARRKELEQENQDLSDELSQYTNYGIYKQNGTWYRADGSTLYKLDPEVKDAAIAAAMKQNSIAWWTASAEDQAELAKQNNDLASFSEGRITKQNGTWVGVDGNPLYTISPEEKDSIANTLVAMMRANSNAWSSASDGEKARLAKENEDIAKRLGQLLGATVTRDASGTWYINGETLYQVYNKIGTKKGNRGNLPYDIYHGGGVVGDRDIGSKERFALLEDGEIVLAKEHFKAIDQMIEMMKFMKSRSADLSKVYSETNQVNAMKERSERINSVLQARTGSQEEHVVNVDASISVSGIVDEHVLQVIRRHPRAVAEEVAKQFV